MASSQPTLFDFALQRKRLPVTPWLVRPTLPGIYAIVHVLSGRMYVGSAANIYHRWRLHRSELRRGRNSSRHLQLAWSKYGEAAFEFRVLETCRRDVSILIAREQHWMDKHRGHLFNLVPQARTRLGIPITESHRHALRTKMKGNKNGVGHHVGRKLSDADIVALLTRYAAGEKLDTLSDHFGIHPKSIGRIGHRYTRWNLSVPDEVNRLCKLRASTKGPADIEHGSKKLTWAKANEMRRRLDDGETCDAVGRAFGVSSVMASRIRARKSWVSPEQK